MDTGERNKILFDKIKPQKETIEKNFGGDLSCERLDGKRACKIAKHIHLGGYRNENNWEVIGKSA